MLQLCSQSPHRRPEGPSGAARKLEASVRCRAHFASTLVPSNWLARQPNRQTLSMHGAASGLETEQFAGECAAVHLRAFLLGA